ncbi:DUF3179 domain-containing protein [Rubrivivax albus]|uniref:DUF3179 domain-containing protein n=2 Tax=Rubrivivax albus TaxID=2499835 RepID=A0A437JS98_9BURK|nr:DUF3179 domain-containing protein [Rubrivivax albus]
MTARLVFAGWLGGRASRATAQAASNEAYGPNGFDLRNALVPAEAIERGGPPRDGIPAIDAPRFVPARDAGLQDRDRVLGLALDGQVRAYPVRILNWHEIVNDRIGTRQVAITYCPLCGTGVAFDATVGGRTLDFGVSGLLYNSDVLLYDRTTQSLWSQILMQAITGPMRGETLRPLPLAHTTWGAWRRRHPATQVLSTDTGHRRNYARDPYVGYEHEARPMFSVQHQDDRLPSNAWVLGLRLGGVTRAYPFDWLERQADGKGRLHDHLGGLDVVLHFDRTARSAEVRDVQGRLLPSMSAYWFAWVAFHPRTELMESPTMAAPIAPPTSGQR